MKKLIPILSLAVLSSFTNTTPLEASLSTAQSHNTPKKLAAITPIQPDTRKISGKLVGGKHGIASWYGAGFHGKKTATGELFDMYAMTAAHNSLPIPSYAEITNVENKRTVIVRINDRGHFSNNRVLDLSYSAAKQLGIDESGTSEVNINAIDPEKALQKLQKQNQPIYLQLGSFSNKKSAQQLQKSISDQNFPDAKIAASSHKGATLYKVQLPVNSSHHASNLNEQLAKVGITDTQFVTETN